MTKKRSFKFSITWFLVILILLCFLAPKIYQTVKKNIELGQKINELEKNKEDLEAQNSKLQEFIANFKKEDYIEKEAKIRLGLKKPGEKVVIIVKEQIEKTKEEIKGKASIFKNFWQKIKNLK